MKKKNNLNCFGGFEKTLIQKETEKKCDPSYQLNNTVQL